MSKYKEISTTIKKLEHITHALDEMGIPYEAGQALPLYGYLGDQRPETAEVVVRRANVGPYANDLGWAWDEATGTYREIISEYDSSGRGADIAREVRRRCAVLQVAEIARAHHYVMTVKEEHGVQRVFLGRAK